MDNILLDLSTKRERPKISIDGVIYELYTLQDHSVLTAAKMQEAADEGLSISRKTDATDADMKRLDKLIDGSIKRIVRDIPKKIIKKLNYDQKIEIIQVFFKAAVKKSPSPQRPGQKSPDSSGSTGEIQQPGSSIHSG